MTAATDPQVTVLRSCHGQMMVARIALAFNGVVFGIMAIAGFRDDSTWLEYPFLAAAVISLIALRQIGRRAYLLTHESISERSGLLLRESAPVRLADVVAITWHRPTRPNRSPQGCVVWTTSGGHQRGLHKMAVSQVTTPEVRGFRKRLERTTGPLGALLVNHSVLSKDDSATMIDWLRDHGFSPVPADTEHGRGIVSLPSGTDTLAL